MWNGQQTIALNKHVADGLRFRNKMANALLKNIPELIGLRTQFVHLYVRDKTGNNPDEFEDYGLFTQVEQPNGKMLQAHGLSKFGDLYKVNFFEFYRYEDVIMDRSDPRYDQAAFEFYLEPKTNNNHKKLIEMLDALNDVSIPIEYLFGKYFDMENIVYWMAFEILIGNDDTQSHNIYIYSPLNNSMWYIIPWDYDGILYRREYEIKTSIQDQSWEVGISNYWGNNLFQRCLKNDEFRIELDRVIEEMRKTVLTEENIKNYAEKYAEVVKPYVYSMPDIFNTRLTEEDYDLVVESLPDETVINYMLYKESLHKPMPFFIALPEKVASENSDNPQLLISWQPSYSFEETNIRYSVELSNEVDYSNILFSQDNVLIPEVYTDMPEPGMYFLRVRAVDDEGRTQDAFDYYVTPESTKVYGTFAFHVLVDGSIQAEVQVDG